MYIIEALETVETDGSTATETQTATPEDPSPAQETSSSTATPGKAQPATPAAALPPGDPFAPESLATPEGLLAAREALGAERAALDTQRKKLDARQIKLQKSVGHFKNEKNAFSTDKQQIMTNMATVRAESTPDDQVLTILSQFTEMAPHDLVQRLNRAVLKRGKAPSAELVTLQTQFEDLKKQLSKRDEDAANAARAAREEAAFEHQYRTVELPTLFKSAEFSTEFPEIVEYLNDPAYPGAAQDVIDSLVALRKDHYARTKHVLDEGLALVDIAHRIRLARRRVQAVASTQQVQSPPPKAAPKPLPATGASLTASDVTDSRSRREMSEEESLDALANDPGMVEDLRRMGLLA